MQKRLCSDAMPMPIPNEYLKDAAALTLYNQRVEVAHRQRPRSTTGGTRT